MTAQQYFDTYQGQSLLWAANPSREGLRGQCVQAVCFYVAANGKPVIWADAYPWYSGGLFPEHYDRIPNSPSAVPQPGDIIVWGPNTPGSGGAGHIAVCLEPRPGTGTFVSVDQNWGGKTVHKVTHNYTNVVGWLRMKGVAAPAPAPAPAPAAAPQPQGDEMIANSDQAGKVYRMLRPNGGASQDEINATAGHRTFANFLNDAQNEVNQRDANLAAQAQHMNDMQATINNQNAVVTDLTGKLNDASVSNADKQKALDDALAQIAKDNADLATAHDQVTDLQKSLNINQVIEQTTAKPANSPSLVARILALVLKLKK